jgi:hypothetical protein
VVVHDPAPPAWRLVVVGVENHAGVKGGSQ